MGIVKHCRNILPLWVAVLALSACGDDGASSPADDAGAQSTSIDAATNVASDAGSDADTMTMTMTMTTDPPPMLIPTTQDDAGVGAAGGCFANFGAECDGDEDCSDGQVCCGTLSGGTAYVSIQCQDSCEQPDGFKLCHGDEVCPTEGFVCRRSAIIPFEFLQVCADPADNGDATVDTTAGEIACRDTTCQVGTEKCCIRQTFSLTGGAGTVLPPLCKPIDEDCGCDVTELTAGDAG